MQIGIIGIGLIGGSFAKAFTKAGHTVAAYDTNTQVLRFALLNGIINKELSEDMLKDLDLILICTYPKDAIEFMEEKGKYIGKKPVVIDCCGTKRNIVDKGREIATEHGFTYVGGHPMAGTHYSGIRYSKDDMFNNATMVIVPPRYDDIVLLDKIKKLLLPCGFIRITVATAEKHDEIVAYTSQLAHVVSSAYIKSPTVYDHKGISAGSYKDMTRVAWLSPEMWTELCMDNRDNLIKEIDTLLYNLNEYKTALDKKDYRLLKELFTEGRDIKEKVDGYNANNKG